MLDSRRAAIGWRFTPACRSSDTQDVVLFDFVRMDPCDSVASLMRPRHSGVPASVGGGASILQNPRYRAAELAPWFFSD